LRDNLGQPETAKRSDGERAAQGAALMPGYDIVDRRQLRFRILRGNVECYGSLLPDKAATTLARKCVAITLP
jgi:hypothetical protein